MAAGRDWVKRNLGIDPVTEPLPLTAYSFIKKPSSATPEDFQREIIDFDSEAPEGLQFLAYTTATGLSRYKDVPWPKGLAPTTGPTPRLKRGAPLPKADVLVVTWTVDEGHALSRVLTPGKDSRNDYVPYTHNYAKFARQMRRGAPALEAKRLGAWWPTKIGKKSVIVFKSDSHMSQDGPKLPNIDIWKQIISEVRPSLVITTGTAGGIGAACEVGDVFVSPAVRFDCISKFKAQVFHDAHYKSVKANAKMFAQARKLIRVNADQLPTDNKRQPRIVAVNPTDLAKSVVTTDFFGFDTSDNHYKLKGLGCVSEMGDAILGLVAFELGKAAPAWLAIRNVSDPQMKAEGTLKQQAQAAAVIYKGFGRWSSICSAITCWAVIAATRF